jgi:hypothetical protein
VITITILIYGWKTWPIVVITEITISLRYTCVTNIQGISSKTIWCYNNNTYTLSHWFLWNTKISKWTYSQYHIPYNTQRLLHWMTSQCKRYHYWTDHSTFCFFRICSHFFPSIYFKHKFESLRPIGSSWPCKYIFISHIKVSNICH